MNTPDEHDAPVDMTWLRECSDNDVETMTSLVTLFLSRTEQLLDELDGALAANSAADVRRIAHACSLAYAPPNSKSNTSSWASPRAPA